MNKKAQLGSVLKTILGLIVFFAFFPFMNAMIELASDAQTDITIGTAIAFIPFIVMLLITIAVVNLDVV